MTASYDPVFGAGRRHLSRCIVAAAFATSTAPALGQATSAGPEIVVIGERPLFGVRAERIVTADDIATYGAATVGELLADIARERGSRGEDAIYLVDGRRVAGLGGIDGYPPEAVERIEVLPEGAGMRVGGAATKRLINVLLKPRVRTTAGRASLGTATEGDFGSRTGEVSLSDIRRPRRVNLTLRTRSEDALLESDRDTLQPADSPTDLGRFRTLRPELENSELRLSASDRISETIDANLNARLTAGRTHSALGLDAGGGAREQRSRSRAGAIDVQLNADAGAWLIGMSAAYARDHRRTDTGSALAATRTLATASNAAAELTASGPLVDLPAGPLSASLRAGIERDLLGGSGDRFVQWRGELSAGLQIPIASAASGSLAALGDLNAGIELSRTRVSRMGTLTNSTFSLQWRPAEWLHIAGSVTTGRSPPAVSLVAAPLLATPGVRYVDPLSGETVDVTELTGGNPAVGAQRSASRRLSIQARPLRKIPLTLNTEYVAIRNRDLVSVLPSGDALLSGAFPERFVRDSSGMLIQVDSRPVTFARLSDSQLRSTLNLDLPLPGSANGGRFQLNLGHVWLRESELQIRSGLSAIDLLSGAAVALGGGARPRHELELAVGYAERGLGLRLTGNHRSAARLQLGGGAQADTLRFSPVSKLGLRGFIDGSRLWPSSGLAAGSRMTLSIVNLTNARPQVRDSLGATPLRYQPAYLDPAGRTVQLELRKSF